MGIDFTFLFKSEMIQKASEVHRKILRYVRQLLLGRKIEITSKEKKPITFLSATHFFITPRHCRN